MTKKKILKLPSKVPRTKQKDPRHQSFSKYILKIVKATEKDVALTADTVAIINSILNDTVKEFVQHSTRLIQVSGKQTITDREMEAATRMHFRNSGQLKTEFTNHAKNHVAQFKQTPKNKKDINDQKTAEPAESP
jgi:hypothetical protein